MEGKLERWVNTVINTMIFFSTVKLTRDDWDDLTRYSGTEVLSRAPRRINLNFFIFTVIFDFIIRHTWSLKKRHNLRDWPNYVFIERWVMYSTVWELQTSCIQQSENYRCECSRPSCLVESQCSVTAYTNRNSSVLHHSISLLTKQPILFSKSVSSPQPWFPKFLVNEAIRSCGLCLTFCFYFVQNSPSFVAQLT